MSLKLSYTLGNGRAGKIIVAAQLANVQLISDFVEYKSLETPAFLAKNPVGKIPLLETPEGYLTESNAILQYVARGTPLVGVTEFQQAKVRQWLDFTSLELEPTLLGLLLPILGYQLTTPKKQEEIKKELNWKLKILENHFKANNFLVGELLTVADLNLATYFQGLFQFAFDKQYRTTIPNITRWYKYISEIPAFQNYYGRTKYCVKAFPIQYEQEQQQQQQQKQEQKQEQSQKQQKQQQQQQQQQQKPAAQNDDEEEKPKKQQCEFDLLPQSPFNIDDWKRQFLASKDFASEFKTFWNIFDSQGWSIWIVKYIKGESEGKVLIQFRNNCSGFLQRADPHFKKWAFAIHGVYGDVPDLQISGAWIWRGTEIPQYLKDHPTFEYLQLTKLDASKPEDRVLFEEYWLNQTEDESKVQGLTARALYYFR
ncbi:unnamed protein product [Paramecium sonneborni]|uniref:Elongation factor 1-gamma n=1 Tax=Paramecium sonneborni TaxID=65129 RepID=A0A8S1KAM9_9CILI|nr:unnamed protein product [Paramecium sonneborni]